MYTTQVPIKGISNGIKVHSDKLPTYVLYSTVIMMQVPGADEVASSASASSRREDLCRSFFMCTVLLHRIPSLYCFEAMSIAQQDFLRSHVKAKSAWTNSIPSIAPRTDGSYLSPPGSSRSRVKLTLASCSSHQSPRYPETVTDQRNPAKSEAMPSMTGTCCTVPYSH